MLIFQCLLRSIADFIGSRFDFGLSNFGSGLHRSGCFRLCGCCGFSRCRSFRSLERQARQNSAHAGYFIADGNLCLRVNRQIHINARTEADKAVAFSAGQFLAHFGVTQNTAGNQACDLDEGDFAT